MGLNQVNSLVHGTSLFHNATEFFQGVAKHRTKVGTIIYQQDILVLERVDHLPFRSTHLRGYGERNSKVETRPHTGSAFHPQLTAHQFHQGLRNHKAKTCAAVLTRGRTVCLRKGIEQTLQLFRSHTDTRILDAEGQLYVGIGHFFHFHLEGNVTLFSKLCSVIDQVGKDLRQA